MIRLVLRTVEVFIFVFQVMVVGDPNAGKSSLIEMLVRTRIFPRFASFNAEERT